MNGLFIATALVPTIGHEFAIRMGANMMDAVDGVLNVIISSRSFEPVSGASRTSAIAEQFADAPHVRVFLHADDNAPQSDDGTQGFWDYWTKMAYDLCGVTKFDYVFASEAYGSVYADQLKAQFIPIDIDRSIFPVKGTSVRHDLLNRFDQVMPKFRKHLARRVTFFGADSTGKTTMAKQIANVPRHQGIFLPEWARPYLECVGSEITDQRMENIALGQYAMQKATFENPIKPYMFQDTDLLSTIGYYRIFGGTCNIDIDSMFRETKSDLYFVMNSGIPYEPDALRYGITQRESTDQFWIDLLEEYDCKYYCVTETDRKKALWEVQEILEAFQRETWRPITEFQRD